MPKIIIIRGLPGSGKSTYANGYFRDYFILSTDDFFIVNNEYIFEPWKIGEAHNWNMCRAIKIMNAGENIIIDNTNSQKWEYNVYVEMAKSFNYTIVVVDLYDNDYTDQELYKRCKHGVPLEVISKMRKRYERQKKNNCLSMVILEINLG